MSLFDFLLVGHLIGDFLFQTSWMARNKASQWLPLIVHVSVYTTMVCLAGSVHHVLPLWAIMAIWLTHFAIDRTTFGRVWARYVQGVTRTQDAWLNIVADQTLHIVVLALVAWRVA